MNWAERSYKGETVWVKVDETESPVTVDGMVPMKREKDQAQTYRVNPENITPLPEVVHENDPINGDLLEVYTDGSSLDASQQGGPTGVGIVLRSREGYREISESSGEGNNITSELQAILVALRTIRDRDRPVRLYTDSEYAVNALTDWIHNWRKNGWMTSSGDPVSHQDLLKKIASLMDEYEDLGLHWVEGHTGHVFNERADTLATEAAEKLAEQ